MGKATSCDGTTVPIRKKFLFADPQKEKKNMEKSSAQKQEFGSPSLQPSLRCQTHAFLANAPDDTNVNDNILHADTEKHKKRVGEIQ